MPFHRLSFHSNLLANVVVDFALNTGQIGNSAGTLRSEMSGANLMKKIMVEFHTEVKHLGRLDFATLSCDETFLIRVHYFTVE